LKTILANKLILALVAGVAVVGIGAGVYFGTLNKTDDTDNKSQAKTQKNVMLNFESPLCDQVLSSTVSNEIGKAVTSADKMSNSAETSNACQYNVGDAQFVTIHLNRQNYASYKQNQQAAGNTITTNNKIEYEHYIATQADGVIKNIVIRISDDVTLLVDCSLGAISEDAMINLAARLVGIISGNASTSVTNSTTSTKSDDEELIASFFGHIDDGEASDAVNLMSSSNTGDDSTKQAWGVQFSDISSVKVVSTTKNQENDWADGSRQYKVVLDMAMDPDSANGPIPYYGYENGQNTRFINLVKEDGSWKIDGIATGP